MVRYYLYLSAAEVVGNVSFGITTYHVITRKPTAAKLHGALVWSSKFISTRHRHFTPQLGLCFVAAMSAFRDSKAINWPAEQEYKGHSVGGLLKYLNIRTSVS